MNQSTIAQLLCKSQPTILSWLQQFEDRGNFDQKECEKLYPQHNEGQRNWLIELYKKDHLLYVSKAVAKYRQHWGESISPTTVWHILSEQGLSWKVCMPNIFPVC
ncbi:hypothetical protein BC828DRAFT_394405 [Blastocladiella britannica]|nr:hypothetical protein BC828DRAFT_394405 [Blastocladiella britannica]